MRLESGPVAVEVEIGIGQDRERGGFGLSARITGVFPESVTDETAHRIMQEAHEMCPYSRAVRGNIDVELAVRRE